MKWGVHREQDCGQDSVTQQTEGGKALVRDLVCLCERGNLQPPHNDLCYAGNSGVYQSNKWQDPLNGRKTWNRLETVCTTGRGNAMPIGAEFRGKKKQFKERKEGNAREYLYTYGGHTNSGLQTCNGFTTSTDGICVMYQRGSDQDSTIGIKWLNNLEDLVKKVEEMSKSASTRAEPTTATKTDTNTDTRTRPNTKPSTEGGSPTERSDEPKKNGNPNTQTAISTETGATTARPPEEQKSSAKIILQSIWVFFFLPFV
uniref:Variant surface glycoprotein n=1 Tax=Trypanosoma brucei TaxID=5691 RepID=A0A1V0FYG8_9TRYP|nr:variant surface glycoprotein [Trypanosoma brucei]